MFSFAVGTGAPYEEFEKISLRSGGVARQLYSNVEVGLELEGYYSDVALPIVANIECKYSNSLQSVCSSKNLFGGQEFYSLGQVENCNEKIALEIENDVLEETEVSEYAACALLEFNYGGK